MSYALVFGTGSSIKENIRWGWDIYSNDIFPVPSLNLAGRKVNGVTVPPPNRQPMAGDPACATTDASKFLGVSLQDNSGGLPITVSHFGDSNTVFLDGHIARLKFTRQYSTINYLTLPYDRIFWPKN